MISFNSKLHCISIKNLMMQHFMCQSQGPFFSITSTLAYILLLILGLEYIYIMVLLPRHQVTLRGTKKLLTEREAENSAVFVTGAHFINNLLVCWPSSLKINFTRFVGKSKIWLVHSSAPFKLLLPSEIWLIAHWSPQGWKQYFLLL